MWIRAFRPPGIPSDRAPRIVWRICGGPQEDIPPLLDILTQSRLVAQNAIVRLTVEGRRVATQDHHQAGTLLARALIESGIFADQARRLVEVSADDGSGGLRCSRRDALGGSAQLVGLLRRFKGVELKGELSIPWNVAELVADVWMMLPERDDIGKDPLKAIGDRGELYSYQFERSRAAAGTTVYWAARDDESLGYDIEVREPRVRYVEAKASGATATRFFLSEPEWRFARNHANYEVQFWGDVTRTRRTADEYQQLREQGFPRLYRNVAQLVSDGVLDIEPTQYVVTGGGRGRRRGVGDPGPTGPFLGRRSGLSLPGKLEPRDEPFFGRVPPAWGSRASRPVKSGPSCVVPRAGTKRAPASESDASYRLRSPQPFSAPVEGRPRFPSWSDSRPRCSRGFAASAQVRALARRGAPLRERTTRRQSWRRGRLSGRRPTRS